MFPWSNIHCMDEYVVHLCIHEDEKNNKKRNVPTPLPLPYPKIYLIIFPGVISYANTSHYVIVFFGAVHS